MQLPQNAKEWVELALSAICPSGAPILVDRLSHAVPFINPVLSNQLGVITAVLAFLGGVGTLQFTKAGSQLQAQRWLAFVGGLTTALVFFGLLVTLTTPHLLPAYGALRYICGRIFYVGLFVAVAVALGAIFAN